MAIIFMDGFEKNSTDKWTILNGASIASSSGYDMSGAYVGRMSDWTQKFYKNLSSSYTELYFTFRWRFTKFSSGHKNAIMSFYDTSGTLILSIQRGPEVVEVRRGGESSTVLATGTRALLIDTTYFFKVYYKPLNSGGAVSVYVDNVLECSAAGDTTAGLENIKAFLFNYNGSAETQAVVDDIVVSTTDLTKNLRIAGKAVIGPGTTTEWDPSTGANYQCVDEVPPVHTDYNSTNVTDKIDTFTIADCTEDIDNIAALQVELSCAYEGSPTPTHLQTVLRHDGSNYASGVDLSPPSSFGAPVVQIYEVNPGTSVAFLEADINALEVGYKATA